MAVEGVKIVLTVDDSQISQATSRVGSNMRTIQTALNKTADSTERIDRHFNGLAGKFRDLILVGGLLRFAFYDIRDLFNVTIGKVIESSAQIEKMTVLMQGLSTATTEQAKALEAIQGREFVFKMAKNAPFEVNALTDSFVKLKSAGMDPLDGTLQTLVDSVSRFGGSSETLKRASVAIQQMSGKGVISMEELRQQLGEAVPTAMRNMATGMGMSMGQLVKNISSGMVGAEDALKRMFTVMKFENAGAAEKLNQTWIGQLEKLKTNISLFTNEIGSGEGGFFEIIKNDLAKLNTYFESTEAKQFALQIGNALEATAQAISKVASFASKYGEELKVLAKTLMLLWAGSVVAKGAAGVISAINSIKNAVQASIATERGAQTIRKALAQQQIYTENEKNNQLIMQQVRVNEQKIALLRAQQTVEEQMMLAHNKRALAAQLSLERGTTTRGAPVNVARATNTMNSQRDLAKTAQENARAFARAQAEMAAANAAATASININSANAAAAVAKIGTAARATAATMGVLRVAFNALGGWIGIISLALTAGAALWSMWGNKAEEAANKAKDAMDAARRGFATLENAQQISTSLRTAEIDAVKLQKAIDNIKKNPYTFTDTGERISREPELKKLEDDLAKRQAFIRDAGEQLKNAIRQGNEDIERQYVDGSSRNYEAMMKDGRNQILAKLASDTEMVNKSVASEKDKQKQITDLTSKAAMAEYRMRAAFLEKENKKLDAQVASGMESGTKMTERRMAQKLALIEKNKELIKEALQNSGDASNLTTPFKLMSADDDGAGASSSKRSKIQEFTENLREKNASLKAEVENLGNTAAKLAQFEQKLISGDFNYTEKVGGKNVSRAPSRQEIIAARVEIMKEGLAQDIAENNAFISRRAEEAGRAFDALETAMIDGEARYQAALDNYSTNTDSETRATQKMVSNFALQREAIVRYHEAAGVSAEHAAVALKLFDETAKSIISNTVGAKVLATAQEWKKQADSLGVSLIENPSERARAEGALVLKALEDRYQRELELAKDNAAAKAALEKEYANLRLKTIQDTERKAETPMQQTARSWRDVTTQMQNASVGWANKTIDAFMELALTGKTSFKGLIESILTDMLRIRMQKQLGGLLEDIFGAIEKQVGGVIAGGSEGDAGGMNIFQRAIQGAGDALKGLISIFTGTKDKSGELKESLGQSAIEGIAQAAQSATTSGSLAILTNAANAAAAALGRLASQSAASASSSGSSGFFGDIFGSIADTVGGWFGGGDVAPSASYGGILGMEGVSDSWYSNLWPFANGGIMTGMGPVELRKYANGGIANSPQLAMFGEGSMNEAYVPLPDGRTIPVTMKGGGSANVQVNVINNASGTEARTEERKNSDGSSSIDVIIEQVESKISKNVSSGRGSLSKVMERTYGLNRAAGAY